MNIPWPISATRVIFYLGTPTLKVGIPSYKVGIPIVDFKLAALGTATAVTPLPPIGDAAYRQHAGGLSQGYRQHVQTSAQL